jgi:predicted kinase
MAKVSFNTLQIVVVCGNYNSGKSVLAAKYFPGFKRVNHNEIRRFIKTMTEHGTSWNASDYDPEMEHLVKRIETAIINHHLERHERVIIDNTCINRESRKKYVQEAKMRKMAIGCVFLDVPVSELLVRNRNRAEHDRVPERIMSMLHAKMELPSTEEGFDLVKIIRET